MKAILTSYLGPTNFKGSRITAHDEDGNKVTIPYPSELSSWGDECHRLAAEKLCEKMGWSHEGLVSGSFKNGWCFCFPSSK